MVSPVAIEEFAESIGFLLPSFKILVVKRISVSTEYPISIKRAGIVVKLKGILNKAIPARAANTSKITAKIINPDGTISLKNKRITINNNENATIPTFTELFTKSFPKVGAISLVCIFASSAKSNSDLTRFVT